MSRALQIFQNLYACEAELFVANSEETLLSKEGTTQGGPESMGVYACGTTPLSNSDQVAEYIKKIFHADDGAAGGKLVHLLKWFMNL